MSIQNSDNDKPSLLNYGLLIFFTGKKKKFKVALLIILIGSALSFAGMVAVLYTGNGAITIVFGCLIGVFFLPSILIGFEFGCEIGFPIGNKKYILNLQVKAPLLGF